MSGRLDFGTLDSSLRQIDTQLEQMRAEANRLPHHVETYLESEYPRRALVDASGQADDEPGALLIGLAVAFGLELAVVAGALLAWWLGPARTILGALLLAGTGIVVAALVALERQR